MKQGVEPLVPSCTLLVWDLRRKMAPLTYWRVQPPARKCIISNEWSDMRPKVRESRLRSQATKAEARKRKRDYVGTYSVQQKSRNTSLHDT